MDFILTPLIVLFVLGIAYKAVKKTTDEGSSDSKIENFLIKFTPYAFVMISVVFAAWLFPPHIPEGFLTDLLKIHNIFSFFFPGIVSAGVVLIMHHKKYFSDRFITFIYFGYIYLITLPTIWAFGHPYILTQTILLHVPIIFAVMMLAWASFTESRWKKNILVGWLLVHFAFVLFIYISASSSPCGWELCA